MKMKKSLVLLISLLLVGVSYAQSGRPQGEVLNFPDYRLPNARRVVPATPVEITSKIVDKINQIVQLKRVVVPIDRTLLPGSSFAPLPKTNTKNPYGNRHTVNHVRQVKASVVKPVNGQVGVNTVRYVNNRTAIRQYYYSQTQQDYYPQSSSQSYSQSYWGDGHYWMWNGLCFKCVDFLFGGCQ
jgi:hypothetical protein